VKRTRIFALGTLSGLLLAGILAPAVVFAVPPRYRGSAMLLMLALFVVSVTVFGVSRLCGRRS
jgi:hypothetical protein